MEGILIKDVMIITMEDEQSIIKSGYILSEGNIIKEIKEGKFEGNTQGVKIIDGRGHVALPGFINGHTHIPMSLLRGYGEGLPLMNWLNEKIWPFEGKLNRDDIYIGTNLGLLEMIHSGTTTFIDMYYMEDVVGKAALKAGVRAFLGSPIIGEEWENQIEDSLKLRDEFKDNPLIEVMIAPHSPYTCKDYVLKKAGEVARENHMSVHIHIAETLDEINIIKNAYGTTPVKICSRSGLFEENNVIAAHCVYVDKDDMEVMRKNSINAVHNPQSNMKLASGTSPVLEMLKNGINVAFGTDGASSNNNLNMIDEMQSAALLQKLSNRDATALSGYETLKMATVNGARAVGMEDRLGKIIPGYIADIILIDIEKPHMLPLHDIYSNLVFSAQGGDVDTMVINGKVIMENNKVLTIDEEYILRKVQGTVEDILAR